MKFSDNGIPRPRYFGRRVGCQKVDEIAAPVVLDVAVGVWGGEDNGHFAKDHLEALSGQFDVRANQNGGFHLHDGKFSLVERHGCAFYDHGECLLFRIILTCFGEMNNS